MADAYSKEEAREVWGYLAAKHGQARCPCCGVSLGCQADAHQPGCWWLAKQVFGMQNSQQRAYGWGLNNTYRPEPASYFEADRDHYRDKWQRTQGIRGALRNLWRQAWR